jgi:hypothetical protein
MPCAAQDDFDTDTDAQQSIGDKTSQYQQKQQVYSSSDQLM